MGSENSEADDAGQSVQRPRRNDQGRFVVYVGPAADGDDEQPVHIVRITRGFWLGTYEVTQAEYEKVTGKNPSHFKGTRNPVERVSWDDAVEFCRKLTEREGAAGRLPEGYEYRLPTEAEWEYGARGGVEGGDTTYAGSNNLNDVGWFFDPLGVRGDDCSVKTHPVGEKQPNELGLYDMSGNVWEWCLDWYDDDYYRQSPSADPTGPDTGSYRVTRGGGWGNDARYWRVAERFGLRPGDCNSGLGFRVALAPSIAAE